MPPRTNQEWSRRIVDAIDAKNRDLREGQITELCGRRRAITREEQRLWQNLIEGMEKQLKHKQKRQ